DLLLAPRRPEPGAKVFVMSYPRGLSLTIALDDNDVVVSSEPHKHGPSDVHRVFYHASTQERSEGGTVVNENWELVAIHNGSDIPGKCNWGVAIDAVVLDAKRRLLGKSVPDDVANAIRATIRSIEAEADPDYFSVFISYSHADSVF